MTHLSGLCFQSKFFLCYLCLNLPAIGWTPHVIFFSKKEKLVPCAGARVDPHYSPDNGDSSASPAPSFRRGAVDCKSTLLEPATIMNILVYRSTPLTELTSHGITTS